MGLHGIAMVDLSSCWGGVLPWVQGACVFTDRWSLDELAYGVLSEGPYQTNLPSPDDIISYIREDREGQVTRIRHKEEIEVQDYQILTREIVSTLKPLEEIIRENVFCLGGNRDHVPACLCYILYCVANSEKFNLAYYMAKRMEWVTKQSRLILPYGMLLTRLFKFIMNENHELSNESYVLYDRVMDPLGAQQERKTRKDFGTRRGRHSTSSSSAFSQPSSSHFNNDDDDGNDEDVPPRPLNPQPLQIHPSLDITLSLSPITPLDHIHDTPSPPSPPQPQPPIMGHPLYYNYHDYHGSNCICFFYNRTLFLTLRDDMNIMFAHLEYLLTAAITSHFPPPP
ncbi:hypothetical protein Tco_0479303 [Tanacetum coccineum]